MRMILLFMVTVLAVFASPAAAGAQNITSIGITPLRQEGEVAPGLVYNGSFTINNSGSDQQIIEMSAETFGVTNQSYDYLFTPGTPETSWISFDNKNLTLQKDEKAEVRYQARVPLSAEPGGYYFALFATHHPISKGSSSITSTERVASLLYLSVTGESFRIGKLVQLNSPSVIFSSTNWSVLLQNSGTVHYRSKYTASTYTLFDQHIGTFEDSRLVLPHSVRLIESSFDTPELLGIYKVVYTVGLGDTPAEQHTRWVLYLPPLQTGLVLAVLLGLFVLIKQRKQYSN